MKKFLISGVMLLVAFVATNAQILRSEELEKYAKRKYGEKWVDAAANLKQTENIQLDKNNSLTFTKVINCGEKSKEELYLILNYWVSQSFNDANTVIKLNDREAGAIICEGRVNVVNDVMNGYNIDIKPIIKLEIKDTKIRITYTVQYYEIIYPKERIRFKGNIEKWPLETHYPFVDQDNHRKKASKAFVMTYAYSNVIIDKIEEAVKNGLVGNENDDW